MYSVYWIIDRWDISSSDGCWAPHRHIFMKHVHSVFSWDFTSVRLSKKSIIMWNVWPPLSVLFCTCTCLTTSTAVHRKMKWWISYDSVIVSNFGVYSGKLSLVELLEHKPSAFRPNLISYFHTPKQKDNPLYLAIISIVAFIRFEININTHYANNQIHTYRDGIKWQRVMTSEWERERIGELKSQSLSLHPTTSGLSVVCGRSYAHQMYETKALNNSIVYITMAIISKSSLFISRFSNTCVEAISSCVVLLLLRFPFFHFGY